MKSFFPLPITRLPRADVPLKGMTGFLSQGKSHQVVFSEYTRNANIPEHSHSTQWGVVLKGKIRFIVKGKSRTFTRGEVFFIPGGARHSSQVIAPYADVQFFAEKSRFKARR